MDVFLSDSTTAGSSTIGVTLGTFDSSNMNGISMANDNLQTAAAAQTALTDINNAIAQVAALRGNIGAGVNRLEAASNVISNQTQNLSSAQRRHSRSADITQTVANLTKYPDPEPDRHLRPGAGEPDAAERAQAAPVVERSFS